MNVATTHTDGRAETLVASYAAAGYRRVEPAILQRAEPFLALSGEDIRRRMFLVADGGGTGNGDLCLRPDLTIPVALDYLASSAAGEPAAFSYLGPVFRQRTDASGEFLQAGIESYGRADTAEADAEALSLALATTAHYGLAAPAIRMGDVGLFAALLDALDLAPVWRRRLAKDFSRKSVLAHDLDRLAVPADSGRPEYQGVLAALANSDPQAAHALVTDLLSIAGISTVGGRSVAEIAGRFLEQAELGASAALPRKTRAVVDEFFAIAGDPDSAADAVGALAKETGIDLSAALETFSRRTALIAAAGIDVSSIAFATAFGRGLDYYTGFVFELHDPGGTVEGQLVAGGRYDGLFARLGHAAPMPAVGFAAWIDRLSALETVR
ncbi:ATP phosphoribosyltransferase regulatory subunit [Rhodovulum sp. PH10]|uniref:ATP phosphoribosyltransferase regulatory subunit n=1 Tax=Rhodovulum sp. PH10 TaxID=1187851 RepID=UPI00027C225F|nr:ATP phosphoribosyltransferase regulatory subunit [Rhodovulum sp. PH10]EJW09583.1 ATP phosphoribosyltransferase regulatory subunit [Rhodovulum sp. PH10]